MPLLNKQPYEPPAVEVRKADEYFVLRASGEVVQDYAAYLDKLRMYRTRQWSCAYTQKGGLTYEEAKKEETRVASTLHKVRKRQADSGIFKICSCALAAVAVRCSPNDAMMHILPVVMLTDAVWGIIFKSCANLLVSM